MIRWPLRPDGRRYLLMRRVTTSAPAAGGTTVDRYRILENFLGELRRLTAVPRR